MKKQPIYIAIIVLLNVVACTNSGKQDKASINSTAPDTVATTIAEPSYDPDPSDTIPGSAYHPNASSKATADLIRSTLTNQLKDDLQKNLVDSLSRKFIFFEYDLNDDGNNEIFVGVTGPYFCGSGGCSPYILDNRGNIITHFSVSDYPIVIDNNKTNGWKDLFIHSGGKDRIVKFDGKKYPSNPSTQPALKVLPGDGLPRALNFVNEPYPWFRF